VHLHCIGVPARSKAKKHLGWEPTVPLKEGLEKTIADFRARKEKGELTTVSDK
jgi:UDP-glucuronate decarboxylase